MGMGDTKTPPHPLSVIPPPLTRTILMMRCFS